MGVERGGGQDDSPLFAHYATGYEARRLEEGAGQLERARTQDVLMRYLPRAPAEVADVGGGTGVYASWLAAQGYSVNLIDLVPLHVEEAQRRFKSDGVEGARAEVGDARSLPYASESQDAVLLLGPLYHLPEREDRLATLQEAWRVLRPGGVVVVAAISRYASLFDGFCRGFIEDPLFVKIVESDLASGRHENPGDKPEYFTTAYFHHPDELKGELEEGAFRSAEVLSVEGPFAWLQNFGTVWSKREVRNLMLRFLQEVEKETSLLGSSAHLLAVAEKPD
jgi:ubiquinone/menaquinone biosynthesis C-methylase UbiE